MPAPDCALYSIAKNDLVHIQRCADCGSVHLDIGAMTLRLDRTALTMLREVIEEAESTMDDVSRLLDWSGALPWRGRP